MVAVKGPISTVDLQAAGRLENGDLEAFLASVGYGTKLPVGGPDPNRPGRGLLRLRDCVVPGWEFSKSARNAKTSSTGRRIASVSERLPCLPPPSVSGVKQ